MRVLPGTIVILLLWLALVGPVLAHASLVSTEPPRDAVLGTAPGQFTLTFNEPVSPLVLTLLPPHGSPIGLADFKLVDGAVEIAAPKNLGTGTFVLTYRVVSSDGHPVAGSVIFSIGERSASLSGDDTQTDWSLRIPIWAAKVLTYLGIFLGVGSVFFSRWVTPEARDRSRSAPVALAAGLLAVPLSVGLQGLDALGSPPSSLWSLAPWKTGFFTSLGPSAAIAAAAMILAMLSLFLKGGVARAAALLALVGAGLTFALTGHAASAQPQWLTRPAVFVHAASITFWAGALLPLLGLLRAGTDEAVRGLKRFSRVIPLVLVPLILAGIVLGVIQVGSLAALTGTAYGRVFLAKLTLLAGVFFLVAVNRWRLTRPVEKHDAAATQKLTQAITVEVLMILAVIGVVALWRFTPPPRSLILAATPPVVMQMHNDRGMSQVTFDPGSAGEGSADIQLMTSAMAPLEAEKLTLFASNPAAGIEAISYPALKQGDGLWKVEKLTIPIAGTWTIRLDIRISDFEMLRVEDQVMFQGRGP